MALDTPTIPKLPSLPDVSIPGIPSSLQLPAIPDFGSLNSPKIATSLFSTGVKEEVATVDVYSAITGTNGRSPITSIQALDLMPDTSLFDKLNGSSTAEFLDRAKQGVKFNESILSERISGAAGDLKGAFGGLTDAMKKGAMLDTFKDKAKYALATVKDTKNLVSVAKAGDMKALGNFVNKYTGTNVFSGKDKGALGGVLSSVVKTSSDLGVSGVFTSIADTVKDNGIIGKITRATLPIIVKNSDSRLFKEISNGAGGKLIDVFSPGFSRDLTRAFTYKGNNSKSLTSFEDILGGLNNINKKWDKLDRGEEGNTATDLWSLASGSQDFQNILFTGVSYWSKQQQSNPGTIPPVPINPIHLLANVFSEVSVGNAIRRDFPKVVMLNLYNARLPRKEGLTNGTRTLKNSRPVDPRLISSAFTALLN